MAAIFNVCGLKAALEFRSHPMQAVAGVILAATVWLPSTWNWSVCVLADLSMDANGDPSRLKVSALYAT